MSQYPDYATLLRERMEAIKGSGLVVTGITPDGTILTGPSPEPPATQAGFVYFVSDGDHIKIGFSTFLKGRVAALQTGNPRRLHMLAAMNGTVQDERALHARFAPYRAEGEWFRTGVEIERFITDLIDAGDDWKDRAS